MLVDCDTCSGRNLQCDGCSIAALLDPTAGLDADERSALALLREQGLIGAPHLAVLSVPAGSPHRRASVHALHPRRAPRLRATG